MNMARCEHRKADGEFDIGLGLVNGLLIAVPLWVILGMLPALVFQHRPMDETTSAALMIAAVCEAILVRPYARTLRAAIQRATPISIALFRQSLALSALVGAYLQYYFLEVSLQIASLNSLTVFLPVTSMT